MNKSSQSKNLVIQLVLRLDRARGSTVFGWRLGLIKMRPCLKSKTYAPFSNRPKNPEFPAFSTIAAASIGHALHHKSDPPKRQENQFLF